MDFSQIGKMLVIAGLIVAGVGAVLFFSGKIPWLGRLPGDIFVKGKNVTFYFPLATSIVISVVLTLLFYLFRNK